MYRVNWHSKISNLQQHLLKKLRKRDTHYKVTENNNKYVIVNGFVQWRFMKSNLEIPTKTKLRCIDCTITLFLFFFFLYNNFSFWLRTWRWLTPFFYLFFPPFWQVLKVSKEFRPFGSSMGPIIELIVIHRLFLQL